MLGYVPQPTGKKPAKPQATTRLNLGTRLTLRKRTPSYGETHYLSICIDCIQREYILNYSQIIH